MKDKTKKGLIIAGLAAVCVIAVFGISRVLYKEPVQTLPEESKATELELMIDTDETVQVPEETESTEKKTDLVIEVETDNSVESGAQEIQPNPEKTEDEKPQEPPVLAEDADVTNPDTKPAYEEEPEKKPENPTPPVMTHRKQETLRTEWYMWKDSDGYLMRVPVLGLPQMTCMKTVIK